MKVTYNIYMTLIYIYIFKSFFVLESGGCQLSNDIYILDKDIYIYTRIPVATLPDSSPPLALRGGSAYSPYE